MVLTTSVRRVQVLEVEEDLEPEGPACADPDTAGPGRASGAPGDRGVHRPDHPVHLLQGIHAWSFAVNFLNMIFLS